MLIEVFYLFYNFPVDRPTLNTQANSQSLYSFSSILEDLLLIFKGLELAMLIKRRKSKNQLLTQQYLIDI
jgi:hypothetical protein